MQREDIAIGLGTVGFNGAGFYVCAAHRPIEAIDQGIKRTGLKVLEAPYGANSALAHLAILGAIAFDQLQISPTA